MNLQQSGNVPVQNMFEQPMMTSHDFPTSIRRNWVNWRNWPTNFIKDSQKLLDSTHPKGMENPRCFEVTWIFLVGGFHLSLLTIWGYSCL